MDAIKVFRWSGVALVTLALAGCADDEANSSPLDPEFKLIVNVANTDGAYCTNLMAGQYTDAGDICVAVEDANVLITYTTVDGWKLTETQLFVGSTQAEMPQTRQGNPKVGNFPYKSGNLNGVTTYTFTIPLDSWLAMWGVNPSMTACEAHNLFVAAHAAVRKDTGSGTYQTETGWGAGYALVDRGNWATGFQIEIGCGGEEPEPEGKYETAFAYGGSVGVCFIDADFDKNGSDDGFQRWGWSNGPLAEGDYTFQVWAGAGRCNRNNGTLVGSLSVSYHSGTATVRYDMTGTSFMGSKFNMLATHLYVGGEPLARDVNGEFTVAPGQYPLVNEYLVPTTSAPLTIGGLTGTIYVVAHAEVGPFPNN
jgi:hypothetical protein